MAKLTMYVQAVPRYYYGGTHMLDALSIGAVTSKKPKRPVAEAKLVKVVLTIPDSVFKDDVPTIEIDVPAQSVTGLTATIGDPEDESEAA